MFQTRNLDEAIAESIQFRKELEEKEFANTTETNGIVPVTVTPKEEATTLPQLMVQVQARYLGYMSGDKEICESYEFKPRSKDYLSDIERGNICLLDALRQAKYDVQGLNISDIDRRKVGIIYDYMKERGLAGRTINKYLGYYTSMCTWLIEHEGYQIKNLFKTVPRRPITSQDPVTITNEEFFRVLKAVKDKELGKQKLRTGEIKSLWKPWLRQAILLSLFTGRRTAEIFQLRFSDVLLDKNEPRYIRTEDIKVNRSHYKEGDAKKYIILAATGELKKLLNDELDYETNKGTSKYLIANDERMKHSSMERLLWRAFAHYSKQVNKNPKLTFKVLRKTNLSRLAKQYGRENTRILSGHNKTSGLKVLDDSYFDKKLLSQVAEGFSMLGSSFPKKEGTNNTAKKNKKEIKLAEK